VTKTSSAPNHQDATNHWPDGIRRTPISQAASVPRSSPFFFEKNVGQADESFDYVARGRGFTLGLTATEAVFRISEPRTPVSGLSNQPPSAHRFGLEDRDGSMEAGDRIVGAQEPLTSVRGSGTGGSETADVRMHVVSGNPQAQATAVDPLVTRTNYFRGDDPNHWQSNVPTFGKVHYGDVYPGIDLVYYGNQQDLEYDFIVAPGVDPGQIALNFSGADAVTLSPEGNLVIQAGEAQIIQPKPILYQDIAGQRHVVEGTFRLDNSACPSTDYCLLSTVYFSVGPYDASRPLVIDPMVLSYSTYLGGPNYDSGFDIAVDAWGSAYLTGEASSGFPLANPLQGSFGGHRDAFVAKFSPDGQNLLYATYLGGNDFDAAASIAVDFKGAAYLVGGTQSLNYPTTPGAFQPDNPQGQCFGGQQCPSGFVTKLAPNGGSLVYSTFLGSGGTSEFAEGIAVDAGGHAYVMGLTNSDNFPVVNAAQPEIGGNLVCSEPDFHPCTDVFITKFNPAGSDLVYSTYLGGDQDEGYYFHDTGDIAIDSSGHAYVTGWTASKDFPTTPAVVQQTKQLGGMDAYVAKLSADGTSFVYSTYLGGGGDGSGDYGYGIAVDELGNAFVTGSTWSSSFPITPGAFQTVKSVKSDTFVSKLNATATSFVYSTYLGGNKTEEADAIVVDAAGNAYVTGWTNSIDFPTRSAFQPQHGGFTDAFVTKLAASGSSLLYSTYLGGNNLINQGVDGGLGLALDALGNVYVGGTTDSINFPTSNPFQPTNAGKRDAFVVKLSGLDRRTVTAQQLS
jgi:hypothetical protein